MKIIYRAAAAAAVIIGALGAAAATAPAQAAVILHSANWAGYITTAPAGQHISSVYAEWTVPQARSQHSVGKPPYQAAMWVGIDGDSYFGQKYGPFQCGVYEVTSSKAKAPAYSLFWEMVPDGIRPLTDSHGHTVHVRPGDHVDARVSYGIQPQYPSTYHKFTFFVSVNGWWYSTTQTPKAGWRIDRRTAEVISEAPTLGSTRSIPGMLDMGTVQYHSAFAVWDRDSSALHPVTVNKDELWHGTRQVLRVTAPSTTPGWQHGPDRFATVVTGRW